MTEELVLEDRWVTEKEAAAMLGTTPGNLRRSRVTGYLWKGVATPPFIKLSPKKVVYSLRDLREFMGGHTRYPSNAAFAARIRKPISAIAHISIARECNDDRE